MKYTRTVTDTIEVVCVYDEKKPFGQHPNIYCAHGEHYLFGSSERRPLQHGDWIARAPHLAKAGFVIIPVAKQGEWEAEDEAR